VKPNEAAGQITSEREDFLASARPFDVVDTVSAMPMQFLLMLKNFASATS
jgi:hypothetical protein